MLRLSAAYWRRKRLEARLLAAELAQLLMSGRMGSTSQRIPAHEMLRMMGW